VITVDPRREFYAGKRGAPASGNRRSARAIFVAGLLAVALVGFLYVRLTNDLASAAYDVSALQSEQRQWQMRNDQLRLEVDGLTSLDRIDRVAATQLGMGPPDKIVYVVATPILLPTPTAVRPSSTPAVPSLLDQIFRS
jgi:cell division protein FtsL